MFLEIKKGKRQKIRGFGLGKKKNVSWNMDFKAAYTLL